MSSLLHSTEPSASAAVLPVHCGTALQRNASKRQKLPTYKADSRGSGDKHGASPRGAFRATTLISAKLKCIVCWAEEHTQFRCHSLGVKKINKIKSVLCVWSHCDVSPCSRSFEAGGASGLCVRVERGRDGVWDHTLQDVALCGHDVLDEEVGSLGDVQIVLEAGDDLQSAASSRHFKYL